MQVDLDEVFEVAKKTASKSPCRYKVSCILVDRRGKIIRRGFNHWSTGNKMGKRTVHAEKDALETCMKPSTGLTAFIYRSGAGGATRNINCCDACRSLMKAYGIEKIFYMTENEEWVRA